MTSNIGSSWIHDLGEKDYPEMKRRVLEALKANFKPEFLNRIDEVIIFHSLHKEHIEAIIEIQLRYLRKRLADKKFDIILKDGAKEFLARQGYDPTYGARPLKRAIARYIQDPLALKLLEGKFAPGDVIEVGVNGVGDQLEFYKTQN